MTTPRDVRNFVLDIKSRGYQQMTETDYMRLCQLALSNLPKQPIKGRPCPYCSWKIGNACKECKNCGTVISKQQFVVIPDGINDCKGECASDLTGRDDCVTLSCGHKFCTGCISGRVRRGFRTCCLCHTVTIPDDIRNKYLPGVV